MDGIPPVRPDQHPVLGTQSSVLNPETRNQKLETNPPPKPTQHPAAYTFSASPGPQFPIFMRSTTLIDENGHFITVEMPDNGLAGDRKEEEHHDFLVDHWMDVAAASYYGFKRYGIGVVVIAEGDPMESHVDHPFDARKMLYRADRAGGWSKADADDVVSEWAKGKMQTYDPNGNAIVVMADDDGSVRSYLVTGDPNPETCFELVRARNN